MKKNVFVLGVLLFISFFTVIGGSYAFFSVIFNDTRNDENNGNTNLSTDSISNATIVSNIPNGIGSFLNMDIYPGHKEVLGLSVTGSGEVNSKSYFQFKYQVSDNGLGSNVKVSVHESDTPIEIQSNHFNCVKKNESIENTSDTKYFEVCEVKNLGKLLQETTLNGGSEEIIIGKDVITIKEENVDVTKYYYVVVEFLNLDESQNEDMNRSLEGKVEVELTTPFEEAKSVSEQNIDYILSKAVEEQIVEDDETPDHNLRYIGASPNNHVSFNNELWRIIGVMNNIDDGTGKKESRIKIIRNNSIGYYSWDSSESSINRGFGVNEWSQADVMKLMNPGYESESVGGSLYWNRGSGTCYNGSSNATTNCDFTSTGLTNEAKKLIGESVWHTGANGKEASYSNILTSKFYELERSSNTGKICTSGTDCNDSVTRTTKWTGVIGLMYPSDYGYATSGGTTTNRNACLNTVLYNWNDSSVNDCKTNNWLFSISSSQWTITSSSASSSSGYVLNVIGGQLNSHFASNKHRTFVPATYLNANVKIVDGDGSVDHPFILRGE